MNELPGHMRVQLEELIKEGLPADQIAFMMRLDVKLVQEEIERANTTRNRSIKSA